MGYTLYGAPGFGSAVVEAAFAEIGEEYEFVLVEKGGDGAFKANIMAMNPRGQIPVLRLPDGSIMTETTAILQHLADAFPEAGMAPMPGSSARAQHDRWLSFFQANVYEGILRSGYAERYTSDAAAAPAVKSAADQSVLRNFRIFDKAIAGPYALGEKISMLDLYVWMFGQWVDQGPLAELCPNVMALRATVAARPEIAAVQARNPS